MVLVEIKITFL